MRGVAFLSRSLLVIALVAADSEAGEEPEYVDESLEDRFQTPGEILHIAFNPNEKCMHDGFFAAGHCSFEIELFDVEYTAEYTAGVRGPLKSVWRNFPNDFFSFPKWNTNISSNTNSHTVTLPDHSSQYGGGVWAFDILMLSANEAAIFFQRQLILRIKSALMMNALKSVRLMMIDDSVVFIPFPQFTVHRHTHSMLTNLGQSIANFDAIIGDKTRRAHVASIDSFPVGSRLHLLIYANSKLFKDTEARPLRKKSFIGLRLKHDLQKIPLSVAFQWNDDHQTVSLDYFASDNQRASRDNKICFDDRYHTIGELNYIDLRRPRADTVTLTLSYTRNAEGEFASCEFKHEYFTKDLDQPMQILEAQGALLLHLRHFSREHEAAARQN